MKTNITKIFLGLTFLAFMRGERINYSTNQKIEQL